MTRQTLSDQPEVEEFEHAKRFRAGDIALLVDNKARRYLVHLEETGAFHTHQGLLLHKEIIGHEQGHRVSIGSTDFVALKPTLAEYIQELPRSTQILYPKDIGIILVYADIFPGARVVEAGLGSGALTLATLRAVGPQGYVTSYEIRPELVQPAMDNIRAVIQEPPLNIRVGDIYQGIVEKSVDRILLDVPEPWHVVPHAANVLSPGGILLCFLPTVLQVHHLVGALDEHTEFDLIESFEVLMRPWHVTKKSIRPAHRMIGHTGFVTTARHCAPGKLFRKGRIRSDGTLNPTDSRGGYRSSQ